MCKSVCEQKIGKASVTSYFSWLVSPFSYCHLFTFSHLNLITLSHLQMLTSSSLHVTHLYIFTSFHAHQYLFLCALYIYIFFLSDIFIYFPLSYISRYTSLGSRAIRRLVLVAGSRWMFLRITHPTRQCGCVLPQEIPRVCLESLKPHSPSFSY